MTWHHLAAFLIVALMVTVCARIHLTDQQFNGVLQLGSGMVGVVGGVAVGVKISGKSDGKTNGNGNGHHGDGGK